MKRDSVTEETKEPLWWRGHHQWTGKSKGFAVQAIHGVSYTMHAHPTDTFKWVLTVVKGAEPPYRIELHESDIGPMARIFAMTDEHVNKDRYGTEG